MIRFRSTSHTLCSFVVVVVVVIVGVLCRRSSQIYICMTFCLSVCLYMLACVSICLYYSLSILRGGGNVTGFL